MEIFFYIIIGMCSGTLAGLFGIGGGIIIVPALSIILPKILGHEGINTMQIATATSLGVIAFTSMSSVYAHYKKKNVKFNIAKRIFPAIILGVVIGSNISHLVSERALTAVFSVFLLFACSKMIFGLKGLPDVLETETKITLRDQFIAIIIGLKSGLLGVGGGILSVPFLAWKGLPLRNAIGTSALFGMIITWSGAISHFSIGYYKTGSAASGLNLTALLFIAPTSMLFAPVGVKLATKLPTEKLKKTFGLLILLVAIKMLIKVFNY